MSYNTYLLNHGKKRSSAVGHRFVKFRRHWSRCPYLYCERCGIVNLKNEETRRHIRRGCAADYLAPDEKEEEQ